MTSTIFRKAPADGEFELVGTGFHYDDVERGYRFKTLGRTITESDITAFVGATGMVEELFTNVDYAQRESPMAGRVAPGALVYAMAEGLVMQTTLQRTGIAFLEADVRVLKPTVAGDTIHVRCEVVETRASRNPARGLLRTFNEVVNQHGQVVLTYNPLRLVKGRHHGSGKTP